MAEVYSMADLFAISSIDDNLPNVLIESLACGTPTVGFDRGGISDIIRPGQTGFLASDLSGESLAREICRLFSALKQDGATWRERCRKIAVEDYDRSVMTSRMLDLYKDLLPGKVSS
jgi:glycosyltransferase involved in cell wall biosynthesis